MLMEEGLDTGAMLGFTYHQIQPEDNAGKLFDILAHDAASLTLKTLKQFDTLLPIKQVGSEASHCKKITKEEGEISFDMSSCAILSKYRGLTPWPGIFLPTGLKLLELEENMSHSNHTLAGTIEAIHKEGVVVTCKEGSVLLKWVQAPSKNAMLASDYVRGKRLGIGNTLA